MRKIEDKELAKFGVRTKHEEMDNGELRFRLTSDDGSGYIRTVAGKTGAWQNSHSHNYIQETYIVQSGWMAFAQLRHSAIQVRVFKPGEVLTIERNVVHNVYLPQGAITHTVKHGSCRGADWIADEEFDRQTKALSERDVLQLADSS